MKISLIIAILCLPVVAFAQQSAPIDLTVTLPTGKVVTFPSLDQKQKFLAAMSAKERPTSLPLVAPTEAEMETKRRTEEYAMATTVAGTVRQKLKEGLLVDDFGPTSDPPRATRHKVLLAGYPEEAQVVDDDEVRCKAVEDGQFVWGAETLRRWRVVKKPD